VPNVLTAELSGSAIAQAATAILRADSLEEALNDLAEAARRLIGAHLSIASLAASGSRSQGVQATSLSDKLLQCRGFRAVPEGSAIYRFLCEFTKPIRLTQREVEGHPSWRRTCAAAGQNPPLRGCLAAPLLRRDGSNLGLMLLSDKVAGEFTADDETALVQLAEVAAAAIETHVALEDSQLTARRFHDFARSTSDWFWELDANLRFTFAPPLPWRER
jgi:GAF domain-containing protein